MAEHNENNNTSINDHTEELTVQVGTEEMDKEKESTNSASLPLTSPTPTSSLLKRTTISPLPMRIERNKNNRLTLTSPRQKYHKHIKKEDLSTSYSSRISTKLPRVATLAQKKKEDIPRKTIKSSSPRTRTKLNPTEVHTTQSPTSFHLFSSSVNKETAASISWRESHPYALIDWKDEKSICSKFPYIPTKGTQAVPKGLIESRGSFLEKAKAVREWRNLGGEEQVRLARQWSEYENKKPKSVSTQSTSDVKPKKLNFQNSIVTSSITDDDDKEKQPPSQSTKEEKEVVLNNLKALTLVDELKDVSIIESHEDVDCLVEECFLEGMDKEIDNDLLIKGVDVSVSQDENEVEPKETNDHEIFDDQDGKVFMTQNDEFVMEHAQEDRQLIEKTKEVQEMEINVEQNTTDEVEFDELTNEQEQYLEEEEKQKEMIDGLLVDEHDKEHAAVEDNQAAQSEEIDDEPKENVITALTSKENDQSDTTPLKEEESFDNLDVSIENKEVSKVNDTDLNQDVSIASFKDDRNDSYLVNEEPSKEIKETDEICNPNLIIKKVILIEPSKQEKETHNVDNEPPSQHESIQAVADSTQASSIVIEEDASPMDQEDLLPVVKVDIIENKNEILDVSNQEEDPLLNAVIKVAIPDQDAQDNDKLHSNLHDENEIDINDNSSFELEHAPNYEAQPITITNATSSDSNESFECVIEQSNKAASNTIKATLEDSNPIQEEVDDDEYDDIEAVLNNDHGSVLENEEIIDKYDEDYEEKDFQDVDSI